MSDQRTQRLTLDLHQLPASVTLTEATARKIDATLPIPFPLSEQDSPVSIGRSIGEEGLDPALIRPMLIQLGAAPSWKGHMHLFHAKPEAADTDGLYHVTARLWGTRTAIRYAPTTHTPFTIEQVGDEPQIGLYLHGSLVAAGEILEPESTCLRNITYYGDGRPRAVDASIGINPIQSCPMRCRFCRRQYDHLDTGGAEPLINLTATQTAEHLVRKYPAVDWSSRIKIGLVTGTFATYPHMRGWVEDFTRAMRAATAGGYRPAEVKGQNIHILSHLARTREDFEGLRELGVKTYQDTAEIVNDQRRAAMMPKANPRNRVLLGKGELGWRQVLASIAPGLEVFGPYAYAVTLILGLDSFEDTRGGLMDLLTEGLELLDRPVYQAFELSGLGLYAMPPADLARVSQMAARLFRTVSTDWNPDEMVRIERAMSGR